jgi:hypothetical protein
MTANRSLVLTLVIASGLTGCATPPPIPAVPTPADIIRAIPQGNNTTVVNVQPQAHHQTLPDFLGITRCCYAAIECCNTARSQAAFCFPGLAEVIEPGAGVLSPEEAEGISPAAEAAADIKAEEAAAQAKIAALRYLATIGCTGCYLGVEEAFIDALDDCTEAVRFEAVMAIRKTMCGGCKCNRCNKVACCSEKIQKKLVDVAYGVDDYGCPKEPSERVRRKARLVLKGCGPPMCEKKEPEEEGPAPEPGEGPPAPPTPLPPPEERAASLSAPLPAPAK